MFDAQILAGAIAVFVLYVGWREYAGGHRRDAALLATFGASVMLGALWLGVTEFI